MRRALTTLAVFLAAISGTGCSGQGTQSFQAAPPNIVFAIADDWGWPHAGAYGDAGLRTPTFDALARDGALFENAYVSSPSCTPSRGAIVTGQHFFRLEAGGNLWSHWPDRFAEYPQLLGTNGYHVGSFRKGWGPGKHQGREDNPAGRRYASVDDFFASRADGQPFAFWFGASDPHRPYEVGSGAADGIDPENVHLFGHYPDATEVRSDVADYYFEVQRFDREVGELLERLEEMGELENTIVVMTGDHGMPFPRSKGNLYDSGARVPLVVRWTARFSGGHTLTDFVSLTDLAPTFLEAAGLDVPAQMTGRSLLPLLDEESSGRVDPQRHVVVFGKERHVPAQAAPDAGGYPMRGLRTDDFLYIHNAQPDRWPAGTPDHKKAYSENGWLADCDNGPTKTFLWEHRDDPELRLYYDLAFAKRPEHELYDLRQDPDQVTNVADNPDYLEVVDELAQQLRRVLESSNDPRALGLGDFFDQQEYLGSAPKWPFD